MLRSTRVIVFRKYFSPKELHSVQLIRSAIQSRSTQFIRTLVTIQDDEKKISKNKKLPELDMSNFGKPSELTEADIHLDGSGERSVSPDGKYADILDINNPPKLTHEHYKMLKGIDFTGRVQWRKDQKQEEIIEWTRKIEAMRLRTDARFKFNLKELLNLESTQVEEEEEKKKNHFAPMAKKTHVPNLKLRDSDPLEEELRKLNELKQEDKEEWEPILKKKKCIFCQPDPSRQGVKQIEYTNVQLLHQFINERGMVKNRRFTNNCMKHQKQVRLAIKRARQIGLLSYISNWTPDHPDNAESYGDDGDFHDRFDEAFGSFGDKVDFDDPHFAHRVASDEFVKEFKPEVFESDLERKKAERQRELRGATHKRKQKNPKDIPGALKKAEYIREMEEDYNTNIESEMNFDKDIENQQDDEMDVREPKF